MATTLETISVNEMNLRQKANLKVMAGLIQQMDRQGLNLDAKAEYLFEVLELAAAIIDPTDWDAMLMAAVHQMNENAVRRAAEKLMREGGCASA